VNVPLTKSPDAITMLEEEKISAYYGAGLLYANPQSPGTLGMTTPQHRARV